MSITTATILAMLFGLIVILALPVIIFDLKRIAELLERIEEKL